MFDTADDLAPLRPARCDLTILMPCLNEAATLAACIEKARGFLIRSGIVGEVLVADNGSTDGSPAIAEAFGARVLQVRERGYGSALLGGIHAAHGRWVIMGDADASYDFAVLDGFVAALRTGAALVMGNRFKGGIARGAMPALHRYIGNPVLTGLGRLFFASACGDFHCGLRGFDRRAILQLDLQAPGMEFASEMVVKATLAGLAIREVPTTLAPDGRLRPPHLRSWHDGWRHLRFLLLCSPRWLFLYPGAAAFLSGLTLILWLLPASRTVGGVTFGIHTLFYASLAVVVGVHAMLFWVFTKACAMRKELARADPCYGVARRILRLEVALTAAAALLLAGLGLGGLAVESWGDAAFGPLSPEATMRLVIPSGTAILLACQLGYGAFFLSVLEMRRGAAQAADR